MSSPRKLIERGTVLNFVSSSGEIERYKVIDVYIGLGEHGQKRETFIELTQLPERLFASRYPYWLIDDLLSSGIIYFNGEEDMAAKIRESKGVSP